MCEWISWNVKGYLTANALYLHLRSCQNICREFFSTKCFITVRIQYFQKTLGNDKTVSRDTTAFNYMAPKTRNFVDFRKFPRSYQIAGLSDLFLKKPVAPYRFCNKHKWALRLTFCRTARFYISLQHIRILNDWRKIYLWRNSKGPSWCDIAKKRSYSSPTHESTLAEPKAVNVASWVTTLWAYSIMYSTKILWIAREQNHVTANDAVGEFQPFQKLLSDPWIKFKPIALLCTVWLFAFVYTNRVFSQLWFRIL